MEKKGEKSVNDSFSSLSKKLYRNKIRQKLTDSPPAADAIARQVAILIVSETN